MSEEKTAMKIVVEESHLKKQRDALLEVLKIITSSYHEPLRGLYSNCVGYNIKVDKEAFDLALAAIALAEKEG